MTYVFSFAEAHLWETHLHTDSRSFITMIDNVKAAKKLSNKD